MQYSNSVPVSIPTIWPVETDVYVTCVVVCTYQVHVHVCVHVCMYMYIHDIHTYIHSCMHTYIHVCMYVSSSNIQHPTQSLGAPLDTTHHTTSAHLSTCLAPAWWTNPSCPTNRSSKWCRLFFLVSFWLLPNVFVLCNVLKMTPPKTRKVGNWCN